MAFAGSCRPFTSVMVVDLRKIVVAVEASGRRIAIPEVAFPSSTANPSFEVVAFTQVELKIAKEASFLVDPSFTVAFGLGITTAMAFLVEAFIPSSAVMGSPVASAPSIEDIPEVDIMVPVIRHLLAMAAAENRLVVVFGYNLPYVFLLINFKFKIFLNIKF